MQYAVENEELTQHLVAAKDAQRQLTAEVNSHPSAAPIARSSTSRLRFIYLHTHEQLQELEEKYSECIEMLHEAQEELKNLRNRNYPAGTPRRYHPLGLYPMVRAYPPFCVCSLLHFTSFMGSYVPGLSGS